MVSIRQILPDEGAAFRAIRFQAIQDSPLAFGSTLVDLQAQPPQYWEDRATSGAAGSENVIFVAADGGPWVGIAAGFIDESAPERRADLVSMWVQPTYRKHGVGQLLVERIIVWATEREARRVVLWVTRRNDAAISLYQRCGFRETGEAQPLPSRPGVVENQMVLDLPRA